MGDVAPPQHGTTLVPPQPLWHEGDLDLCQHQAPGLCKEAPRCHRSFASWITHKAAAFSGVSEALQQRWMRAGC